MSKSLEAKCTVYKAAKPNQPELVAGLRFDDSRKTITAGKNKIKLSDLQEDPRVDSRKVTLVSSKMRIVTPSTTESRGFAASVTAAAGREGGGGKGNGDRNGNGNRGCSTGDSSGGGGSSLYGDGPGTAQMLQWSTLDIRTKQNNRSSSNRTIPAGGRHGGGRNNGGRSSFASRSSSSASRTVAFKPTNTLMHGSRPAQAGSFDAAGKRGKQMAASAAGVGAALPQPPPRGGSARGARSSGQLSRKRNLENEELLPEAKDGSSSKKSSSSSSSSIISSASSASSASGAGTCCGAGGGSGVNVSSGTDSKKSGELTLAGIRDPWARNGIRDSWAHSGKSPPFPPLLSGQAAVDNRRGGVHGGLGGQQFTRYMVHRETVSRREGFRNMGNTCYLNACLQGLLSLSGFIGDLQRKCWVLAMLKPPPAEPRVASPGDCGASANVEGGGSETVIDVRDSQNLRNSTMPAVANGGRGGRGDSKPSLYDALLRLSLEAKGSHGLMDASPLKRAMDRHSDRFAGNLQQDAHEFLSDLINVLHEEAQPKLDTAAAYVRKPVAAVGGGGGGDGRKTAAAGAATKAGADRVTTGQAGVSSTSSGVGRGGRGGVGGHGNGVVMVDLSSTGSENDEQEELDAYAGDWDDDEAFVAAADAAVAAAAAAAAAGSSASSAVEVFDDDGTGISSSVPLQTTTTTMAKPRGRKEGEKVGDEDGKGYQEKTEGGGGKGARGRGGVSELEALAGKGEEEEEDWKEEKEEELALREREREQERERLMPTTRHFHAEIEVTLTCTRCSYSRRRRELYRDFSLDIPDPAMPQQKQGGNAGGAGGKAGTGSVSGLDKLLEGFFQLAELNLRCERCGHDRVRAEHSVAELPGALVLHIKRFKPVIVPVAAAPKVVSSSSGNDSLHSLNLSTPLVGRPPNAADSDSDVGITTPPIAIVGEGSTGGGNRSGSSGGGGSGGGGHGGGRSYGGVSYVKLTAPVSVPLELDLERFCTEFTGNAPAEDLGTGVDSLKDLGIPFSSSSSSCSPSFSSSANTIETSSSSWSTAGGALHRAPPKKPTPSSGGGKKRCPEGISVDLSMREGWSSSPSGAAVRTGCAGGGLDEASGNKRFRVGDGEGDSSSDVFRFPPPLDTVEEGEQTKGVGRGGLGGGGGGGRAGLAIGAKGARGGALFDSTNTENSIASSSRGVRETANEKKRKEKENAAGRDRWVEQDRHNNLNHSRNSNRMHANGVPLDSDGNVDYFRAIGLKKSNTELGSRPSRSPFGELRRTGLGESGRLVGGRPGFPLSVLGGADKVSEELLAKRKKRLQQMDVQEQKQLEAAIAASHQQAFGGGSAAQEDEESDLARAIRLSREEVQRQPGADDKWTCSTCTLENEGGAGSSCCSVCLAPKPEQPSTPVPVGGAGGAKSEGCVAEGGGLVGEEEDGAVFVVGGRNWTAGVTPPSSGGDRQQQQPKKRHAEKGEEAGGREREGERQGGQSPVATPEPPQPRRVARKGPLRARYKLRGVLHHLGRHAFAGHYVTDVREEGGGDGDGDGGGGGGSGGSGGSGTGASGTQAAGGKGKGREGGGGWKRHDDSVVAPVSEARALGGAAQRTCYICFYSLVVDEA